MTVRRSQWRPAAPAPRTMLETLGHIHPTDDTWVLWFGWPTNPLPANGPRGNHFAHAAEVRGVLQHAWVLITAARIPALGRCEAQLTWWVQTRRSRDEDNLAPLEKPLFDAIVRAGVVRDDTPDLMRKPRGRIRPVDESDGLVSTASFTLHIRRLDPEQAA